MNAEILKLLRLANRKTQAQAAQAAGMSLRTYQQWEQNLYKIAPLKAKGLTAALQAAGWIVSITDARLADRLDEAADLIKQRNKARDSDIPLIDARIIAKILTGSERPENKLGFASKKD